MSRAKGGCISTLALVLALLPARLSAQPQVDEAEKLFRRGKTLHAAGDLEGALTAYQRSQILRPSFDTAGNASQAAARLGRWRDACNFASYSLSHLPASMDGAERAPVEEELRSLIAESLTHVGKLRVVTADRVEVDVDDAGIGVVPLDPETHCLDPGLRRVRLKLEGHTTRNTEIHIRVGETTVVELPMLREIPPTPSPMQPLAPSVEDSDVSAAVLVPLGVGAAAAIGVGIGLLVFSESSFSDADSAYAALASKGSSPCIAGGPNTAMCQEIDSLEAKGDGFRAAGVTVAAVGGALAVGALLYGLWPRDDGKLDAAFHIAPMASDQGAGAMVFGEF